MGSTRFRYGGAECTIAKAVEDATPELKDVLPRGYQKRERSTLIELLRLFAPLPTQLEGDAFGFIYEDFLSDFAAQEGKGGGEYFTPYSIVRLIVEILQPFQGRVFEAFTPVWIQNGGTVVLAA
ncbi:MULTISPECIES: N-6 DNA methylase [Corynebacterium]|uniref:N-6 DNA methylase n=1 Tax=Corynebacterium TaxID=1716 RepID=UPI001CEFA093|nr:MULTISPECIES: N-6 DNA methylase [Corynebacterium]